MIGWIFTTCRDQTALYEHWHTHTHRTHLWVTEVMSYFLLIFLVFEKATNFGLHLPAVIDSLVFFFLPFISEMVYQKLKPGKTSWLPKNELEPCGRETHHPQLKAGFLPGRNPDPNTNSLTFEQMWTGTWRKCNLSFYCDYSFWTQSQLLSPKWVFVLIDRLV